MNFKTFIKDKILAITLLTIAVITIEIFLIPYRFGSFIKLYIPIIIFFIYVIVLLIEYFHKRKFYQNLQNTLDSLEEKYLIAEIIKDPNFLEGKILRDIILQVDASMIENVNKYKYIQEEYKDYIELWIHEIKLPIASGKMVIENNKNAVTKSIDEELDKIESYTEQALFYARSNTLEKDYYIKKSSLKEIVNESIKKNKNSLIQEKIILNIHDLDLEVYTDSKWMIFILNQLIQNSRKYKKPQENLVIEIYAKQNQESVTLCINDNGIGIKQEEITKVFEKGFTGTNGRNANKRSTGIGLYLCKKLCHKLGLGIALNSQEKIGTQVKIIFPKSTYVELKSSRE